jgi:energy-coupling factor transporter ATP-binding protein EcfA2
MAQQYIFQMQGLTKAYPGGKKVFENIWLSFYSDAKIGVVGVNGSGKSTLLKIMAGMDKEFSGEAKAADGVKMGYLEQEPHLDDSLNVRDNVIAWCDEKKIFDRYNEVAALMGEEYSDELMEEMTKLQEQIDAADASPLATALREADEEIGLASHHVTPLGFLDPYLSATGFRIIPVMALVADTAQFQPNAAEVEAVFEVPLRFLMDPSNHQQHSAEWRGAIRKYYAIPYETHYIWGVTAGILRNLYERLYAA